MTNVLMGAENQREMYDLYRDPAIFSMIADLLAVNETYKSIKDANNFSILNKRYKALTGKDTLRIGAVKDAILTAYPREK